MRVSSTPDRINQFFLGCGFGAAVSVALLAAAQVGLFGAEGKSDRFLLMWARMTCPIVSLACGGAAVFSHRVREMQFLAAQQPVAAAPPDPEPQTVLQPDYFYSQPQEPYAPTAQPVPAFHPQHPVPAQAIGAVPAPVAASTENRLGFQAGENDRVSAYPPHPLD